MREHVCTCITCCVSIHSLLVHNWAWASRHSTPSFSPSPPMSEWTENMHRVCTHIYIYNIYIPRSTCMHSIPSLSAVVAAFTSEWIENMHTYVFRLCILLAYTSICVLRLDIHDHMYTCITCCVSITFIACAQLGPSKPSLDAVFVSCTAYE
jgi:hypothetical protein